MFVGARRILLVGGLEPLGGKRSGFIPPSPARPSSVVEVSAFFLAIEFDGCGGLSFYVKRYADYNKVILQDKNSDLFLSLLFFSFLFLTYSVGWSMPWAERLDVSHCPRCFCLRGV